MIDRLGRVEWEMGQTLLPEHLVAQEDSLIAESILRFRANGLPDYGVVRLQWNETLLLQGVFAIQGMVLIMPSGMLLSLRENAVVSPYNLNVSGSVEVPVYCHLLDRNGAGGDGGLTASGATDSLGGTIKRVL